MANDFVTLLTHCTQVQDAPQLLPSWFLGTGLNWNHSNLMPMSLDAPTMATHRRGWVFGGWGGGGAWVGHLSVSHITRCTALSTEETSSHKFQAKLKMPSGIHNTRVQFFRWFEVGCAIWAQMSQIGASQIEAPIGSLFQKYVYICFMVKMKINLGSFGLFWFILGWR